MTNLPSNVQLPAHLQNRQSAAFTETIMGNLGGGTPAYVSIQGGRFTLIDATGAQEPITTVDPKTGLWYFDACIAQGLEVESKIYYTKPFDPNAAGYAPPDCWSDNGIGPSRNASNPQHPTCGTCPMAVWGSKTSKVTGRGIPACSKYQKLALVLPGDDIAFLLRVPPNSLGNLQDYLTKCKSLGLEVSDLLTRVSFEPQGLGTLTFTAANYIDPDTAKHREELFVTKGADQLLGRGDKPREALLPAPAGQAQAQLPAGAPQQSFQPQPMPGAAGSAGAASGGAASQSQQVQPQQPVQQAQPAEPARRKRRTQAQIAADNAQPGGQPVSQPDVLPATAPFRPQAPAAQPGTFGIQPGAAPDAKLNESLNQLFGPAPGQ